MQCFSHNDEIVLQATVPKAAVFSMLLHIDSLVQDCSIYSALAMEILQYCTKPSIYTTHWLPLRLTHWLLRDVVAIFKLIIQ